MYKKFGVFVLLMMSLVLSACSGEKDEASGKKEAKQKAAEASAEEKEAVFEKSEADYYEIDNLPRELTEVEQEMLRKPGEFSGDAYNEEKVNERLDQLPDDLTEEEYFGELLALLAEDYHKELETYLFFDTTVDVDIARPDEAIDVPTMKTTHYAILMDASGSMLGQAGGKVKMTSAKEAVNEFVENIPGSSTVSLTIYGHKGSGQDKDKAASCAGIETIYNGSNENGEFAKAMNGVKPAGWTPIGAALESVKKDIPAAADEVVVYVVSDGIETCGGNPVAAAENLASDNIQTVVNIIGFDVDQEGQNLLKEVADAGNGEFTYVGSEQELKKYMRKQYEELQDAWYEWKEAGKKESFELKEEKKALANETKESIKEKSNREKERMKAADLYLKEKYKEDYDHPARKLFNPIIDYCNDIWGYGVDTGNELWSESVDNGNNEHNRYMDEGNEKINEAIDKKNGSD